MGMLQAGLKWTAITVVVGALAGTASAAFLAALEWATGFREGHSALIWALPVAGFALGWIYHQFGRAVEAGNNLLIDEIHEPRSVVPVRMAPLIFVGTVMTHLFGGSAGREGTAVQMGGAFSEQLAQLLRLSPGERRTLLMAGMSGGFGSVFGVPWAGAIFGLEVLQVGRFQFRRVVECWLASMSAHFFCLAWGIHHTVYPRPEIPALSARLAFGVVMAGAVFGICAWAFAFLAHKIGFVLKKFVVYAPLRPLLGGAVVIAGFFWLGNFRYAGLGIPVIVESLRQPGPVLDFFWKTLFTVVTIGSGMKGGEVTPLLFIGSTLGNALAGGLALPVSLAAALGLVAVFAGAANTPWACTVMAMELFGPSIGPYAAIACWMSYYCSGHGGIYHAQKISRPKWHLLHRLRAQLRARAGRHPPPSRSF